MVHGARRHACSGEEGCREVFTGRREQGIGGGNINEPSVANRERPASHGVCMCSRMRRARIPVKRWIDQLRSYIGTPYHKKYAELYPDWEEVRNRHARARTIR